MIIEIEPLDNLIFRDGRPFNKGEDNWIDSLKIPSPTTIYGALRATYFSQNPKDFEKIKTNDVTEKLRIKGIYLCKDNEILYQVPKDCVKKMEDDSITTLKLKENNLTSNCLPKILSLDIDIENVGDMIFDEITFEDYINGKDTLYGIDLHNYITIEHKIGIGKDKSTKTVKDGLLYRVQMLRYAFKIIVEFEGIKLNNTGFMKFGGEAKGAYYCQRNSIDFPEPSILVDNLFKLYFLTPAFFKKGWIPNWINENEFIGEYKGLKLKLLSCAIGKPTYIGGFDLKENKPKEMLKAIPAGSVYYFKLLEGDSKKLAKLFHKESISEYRANEGYGITILSKVSK